MMDRLKAWLILVFCSFGVILIKFQPVEATYKTNIIIYHQFGYTIRTDSSLQLNYTVHNLF